MSAVYCPSMSGEKVDTGVVLLVWLTWRPNGKICLLPRACEQITSIHCSQNDHALSPIVFRRAGSNVKVKLKDKSGVFYSHQPVPGLGLGMKGLHIVQYMLGSASRCTMYDART